MRVVLLGLVVVVDFNQDATLDRVVRRVTGLKRAVRNALIVAYSKYPGGSALTTSFIDDPEFVNQ
jgi:hypothetical protein